MATPEEEGNVGDVSLPGIVAEDRGDSALDPEVRQEEDGQNGRSEQELRLLEQLVRMREMFSAKEAELAEARSELAYTQQEMEAAKEEVTET